MFKFLVNTPFTLRSHSSRFSDKDLRGALLIGLLLDWYVEFISDLLNFLESKLVVLFRSDEKLFSLKDTSWLDS